MKLMPKITPEILDLLGDMPLADRLRSLRTHPTTGMVYADDAIAPSTCVVRMGARLFVAGCITSECLAYIRSRILTFEIYERYGVFDCYGRDEDWLDALAALYPGHARFAERGSRPPEASGSAANAPMMILDLRDANRGGRAPAEADVLHAVRKYLPEAQTVGRVPKGQSTYVYRVSSPTGTHYARFLPEDHSFAAEVMAHERMIAEGIRVPRVVAFEHREARSALSMMLTQEIPGDSMEDRWPEQAAPEVLREAGRQLARIHAIPVDGFGWIDRRSHDRLKAEKPSFLEYFDDCVEDDLHALRYYDFTATERERIRGDMEIARRLLDVEQAVLVHGDFDVSHIFQADNEFTGFIDFGEIRGNNRLFDLAVFVLNDASPGGSAYADLLAGYREAARFSDDDRVAVALMALFIALRFAGKKVETPSRDHWCRAVRRQLGSVHR